MVLNLAQLSPSLFFHTPWLGVGADMEKVASLQALYARIACGQFLRKLWMFLDKQQIFGSFYPSMVTCLHYISTINLSNVLGKIAI